MVQNGPNDHFGQNYLIPNWILFSTCETKMVHLGPFWPEEVHFGPFRSTNRTLAIPEILSRFRSDFEPLSILFASKPAQNRINSGSKSDRSLGWSGRVAASSWAWTWLDQMS